MAPPESSEQIPSGPMPLLNLPLFTTLPVFMGDNASEYFDYFDKLATLAQWSEDQMASMLLLKLAGPAKAFYEGSIKVKGALTYTELKCEFFKQFNITKSLAEAMTEVNFCLQHPEESVRDFSIRLQGLVSRALSGAIANGQATPAFRDTLLLSQFITGLRSNLKQQVMIANPQSLGEATILAGRVEEALKVTAPTVNAVLGATGGNPFHDINAVNATSGDNHQIAELTKVLKETTDSYNKTIQSITNQLEKLSCRVDSLSSARQPVGDRRPTSNSLTCFYCGRLGHISRNCFKKQRDLQNSNTSQSANSRGSNNNRPLNS